MPQPSHVTALEDADEATLYAHLHDPPPDARELAPEVPGPLADVVRRALAKDPGDRFPSAGDLGRAALAGQTLSEMGFPKVYNLGGFQPAADAGMETEGP